MWRSRDVGGTCPGFRAGGAGPAGPPARPSCSCPCCTVTYWQCLQGRRLGQAGSLKSAGVHAPALSARSAVMQACSWERFGFAALSRCMRGACRPPISTDGAVPVQRRAARPAARAASARWPHGAPQRRRRRLPQVCSELRALRGCGMGDAPPPADTCPPDNPAAPAACMGPAGARGASAALLPPQRELPPPGGGSCGRLHGHTARARRPALLLLLSWVRLCLGCCRDQRWLPHPCRAVNEAAVECDLLGWRSVAATQLVLLAYKTVWRERLPWLAALNATHAGVRPRACACALGAPGARGQGCRAAHCMWHSRVRPSRFISRG